MTKITKNLYAAISESVRVVPSCGRIYQKNGITLLQNMSARQLVIFSHGGWKQAEARSFPLDHLLSQKGDGVIENYQGPRIDFYTPDGSVAKGLSVLTEISARPADALSKLAPRLGLSADEIENMARLYGRTMEEMSALMLETAIGCEEQVFPGAIIKDYALYHHEQNAAIARRYQENGFHPDIDIALVAKEGHKRHLSDVLTAAELSGVKYDVIHFATCRVDR